MTAPEQNITDPIYSELSTAEKIDNLYAKVDAVEQKFSAAWQEIAPLLADIMPMVEAIQESSGFQMLVGRRAAKKLREGKK